ncbi:hypothetical protein GEMRC1_000661 [Eukaryota sp. GEM-RC1]
MIRKSSGSRNFLIFCLQNLIESWSSGKGSSWQPNDVKDGLESINLSLLTGSEIQSLILSPLGDDDELVLIISKITNKVIVPSLVESFELQKEELKKELENINYENVLLMSKNNELEAENLVLCNQVESFKQKVEDEENERKRVEALNKAKSEENERRIIELSKNVFNSNNCGSFLSLSNNNTVVKKNGASCDTNCFVEVDISDNCSVKFTRLDDLGNTYTDFIGWKDITVVFRI